MAKKLQQYTIYKFESDRLKDFNYKIQIDLDEARRNNEVVQLGESELIRIIYRLKNKEIDSARIAELNQKKKVIKNTAGSKDTRKSLSLIDAELDDLLFIPEIITVKFTDARHFAQIVKKGLFINGKKYVRLLTGSGMARRATSMLCEEEFSKILKPILDNDRDKSVPLVSGKYNAYYALLSSAGLPVTTPRICVVNDYEYTKDRLVDFVVETEGHEDRVEERTIPIVSNAFDGMGIISKEMAMQWSIDLDLHYTPTSFCVRGAYLKGQVVAFDFKAFADEVAGNYIIKDLWGNLVDIREVDCILSKSQLKMYNCYKSCDEYMAACERNGIGWSVSRYTPEHEKDTFQSSYQLLQVLDLDQDELVDLARPTMDWLSDVSGGNVEKTLLFLLGETANEPLREDWWDKINDPITKALLLYPGLAEDKYIQSHIIQSLRKKMNDAAMGVLTFNGNWQVAISDPYAFCENAFGLEVNGLLKEHEHFNGYWNNKGVTKVACARSPITWKSEMNLLNLQNNPKLQKWFGHLKSGIVLNIHGVDTMLFADGDFDYDILVSTDNPYFIKGASLGKPVTYEKKGATKHIIVEDDLYLADCATFGSHIGFLTNLGTTMYSMLPQYEKGSEEYNKLIERLIIVRKLQGAEIDRAKLMTNTVMPDWDKWTRIKEDMTPEEKHAAELNNKLVLNRRPRWMIYLYKNYKKKYQWNEGNYENFVDVYFNSTLSELAEKEKRTPDEEVLYNNYNRFNYFIDSTSNLGVICKYVESRVDGIKQRVRHTEFDLSNIISAQSPDPKRLAQLKELFKFFEINQHDLIVANENAENISQFIRYTRNKALKEITTSSQEIIELAVYLAYVKKEVSVAVIWKLFGNDLVSVLENRSNKMVRVPVMDKDGDISYLGKQYSVKEVAIT